MRTALALLFALACRGTSPAPTDVREPPPDCPIDVCDATCTDLRTDPKNCGECGTTCVISNAEPACVDAQCELGSCDVGWEDCDGDPLNGCEAETLCIDGAACETECGSVGSQDCTDPCAPICVIPDETCNLVDDTCDGSCDEGLEGCRQPVYRADGAGGHVYGLDEAEAEVLGRTIDIARYFEVMTEPAEGTQLLHRCALPDGTRFLTLDAGCDGKAETPELMLGYIAVDPRCEGTPLFGLYSASELDYFYTLSERDRDRRIDDGYVSLGTIGYVWRPPR